MSLSVFTPSTHWTGDWLAQQLVWVQRLEEKFFAFAEDGTPVVQSVVRHYID
jgi:hypothetical protein